MENSGRKYFHANSTGTDSSATGADAIAIGSQALASGDHSIAQGFNATASATNATAIGTNAKASAENSVALGANASASSSNSVALGANSVANGSTLSAAAYNPARTAVGTAPVGEVSVGSAGAERRVTNVAAGSADTDAVNVSQLKGLGSSVLNQANQYADNIAKRAYGGVASALALEPMPYIAGTWAYAVGVGYYQGEAAMGVSARLTAANNRWSITGGVTKATHGGIGGRMAIVITGETN